MSFVSKRKLNIADLSLIGQIEALKDVCDFFVLASVIDEGAVNSYGWECIGLNDSGDRDDEAATQVFGGQGPEADVAVLAAVVDALKKSLFDGEFQ